MASEGKIELKDLSHQDKIRLFNPKYMIFNSEWFLKEVYNINNFEECVEWVKNNKSEPVLSRARIIDFGLKIFKDQIDVVDHRFVNFFIIFFNRSYIFDLYQRIYKHLDVRDGKVIYVEHTDLHRDEYIEERIKYIQNNIVTKDIVHKYLLKYIKTGKESDKNFGLRSMCLNFIEYVKDKFKATTFN